MANITLKKRTGKDFFEFTERSLVNEELATLWSIETFVLVDGQPLESEDVFRLSDRVYIMLSNTVFSLQTPDYISILESGEVVYSKGDKLISIKPKEIKRDTITKIQTTMSKKNVRKTDILKEALPFFYEVSIEELLNLPYEITAALVNQANFFLSELSQPKDEFVVADELLFKTSEKTSSGGVDSMVQNSDRDGDRS